MADKKISALTASTTPLAGTEVLPIVQGGSTVKVSVANLTAGRTTAMSLLDVENAAGGGVLGTFKSNWSNTKVAVEGDGATGAGVLNISNVAASAALPFKIKLNGTEVIDVDTSGNAKATIGNFVIGTANKGIDFSANANAPGMTSELLNDYEEGTWTPTFTSTGATITHAQQRGAYTKVGRLVTASVYVQISSVTGTLTNSLTITGLPFATIPTLEYGFSAAIGAHQFTSVTPSMFMAAGSSTINVYVNGTVTPITAVAISAGYYLATISYMVG